MEKQNEEIPKDPRVYIGGEIEGGKNKTTGNNASCEKNKTGNKPLSERGLSNLFCNKSYTV
ncbi:hypothetical protein [Dyadobacter sp. CY343]|uniref:hypothetical protein n=1 Tax=Dyadobacter sp. CY343 TaxID=2907299 RepID=UPI001F2B74F6|nr:hypothetical protein [Dyadobacter sp. CY343]MCE7061200.1 hypothetical protein [Dyadobacter sp. CY343]